MDVFSQLTISGLSNGMIYALVGVGFVIIYKASDVINFAQGDFLLLGAYLAYAFILSKKCFLVDDVPCFVKQ